MDSNYANAGGGIGGGGTAAAVGVGAGVSARYNAVSCQRSVPYNAYDPYGGGSASVRASSAYPYDAEAEFKERTGMGKSKTTHLQMAGNSPTNSAKVQQQHSYNANSCYGSYNQNTAALKPESANYYAYAYDQHHHYSQQQQQQQYHQSQLQQQYKYNVNAKVAAVQQQQQQQHLHQQQQHQQNLAASAVNAMKMSPPEYGYAPYHHLQHPYYHPHYHHSSQKGGVSVMKTIPDASAMPYVNSKMIHSGAMGGTRAPQYPSNYSYHPHSYPSTISAGHHTYQSQSVCDDSRWLWNNSGGIEYQNSCRSAYPAYVNGSGAKQTSMWPSMPIQYQNTMSTGYPAAAAVPNQSCCPPAESAATYYPQQYVKYPVQSLSSAMDYNGSNNDLYSSTQVNSVLSAANATAKVHPDLSLQPQTNSYQSMNTSSVSYHQPSDYSASGALDYNARYLQQQQTDSPSSSSTSSTSSYNHHYYHNLHPYAHQPYSTAEPQEDLYAQQQVDTKISLTTKSQSLRDFLTSWNEDEDDCPDRTMSSTDIPFMEQLHLAADHFSQSQEQQQTNPFVENHLQFKGSFTSRPKIHVGITVDSTVESDQYINLPDIIIDIEKSSKDVVSLPEDILVANIPKIEKEEISIKEEKQDENEEEVKDERPIPPPKKPNDLLHRGKKKFIRKIPRCKGLAQLQRLRLLAQRNQRRLKLSRKLQRPKIRRVKKSIIQPRLQFNPQSLKCLCVSLINSDKFRNRILGPSEIDSLINLTTENEVNIDVAVAIAATGSDISSSSLIPKLSDLCKNALNSSFDRDVLVINLDEILDSDNLFVVQCDINENILENYVDQQQIQQQQDDGDAANDDLVEILNDNNNYNDGIGSSSSSNYIPTTATVSETTTKTISSVTEVTRTIEELKRCCSVTEVSNLPLDNAVEHNNNFNSTTNPIAYRPPQPRPLLSPSSSSCPAKLFCCPSSSPPLIEQNCPTQQIAVGHEQLHEMLMLSGIVHDVNIDEDDRRHHLHDCTTPDDGELLMLASAVATPSIHHEEIVPDNLKKFQNEKFLKYLHAKYVQGNLSEFYHANRIIKKYKKRIIKKILNIVR